MPRYKHDDWGDITNTIFAKGVITEVYPEDDTADVTVEGYQNGTEVPIFYHCSDDAEERSNGAIEGGSSPFGIDDEVIVMCRSDGTPIRIIGFVDGIRACFGYMVVRITPYCFVWDFRENVIATDVFINDNPEIMAEFPVLISEISQWIETKDEVVFENLFSKETESDIAQGDMEYDSGTIYDRSYECVGPLASGEWYEDFSNYERFERHNTRISIFGTDDYWHFDDYRWNEVLAEACPGAEGDMYWNVGKDLDEEKSSANGFKLTALNESGDEIDFYVINSYTLNIDTWEETDWYDCLSYNGTDVFHQTLSPNFPYFPTVTAKTRNHTGVKTSCDGGWTGFAPEISLPLTIGYAGYYSEAYRAIAQLFIYKDADANYQGYGTADVNIDDVKTIAPSILSEKPGLSAALKTLAETSATYGGLQAQFYK